MQRGRGRGDVFGFGDPFAGFGCFGEHRSLMSSVFGKDPFDDPFFSDPFGRMAGPRISGDPSMFGPGGSASAFGDFQNTGFPEHQVPQANHSKGPVIEELSDDEDNDNDKGSTEKKDNPMKHSRSNKAPLIEEPDDEGRKKKQMLYRNESNGTDGVRPQTRTYSFQSSTVTYGGANGAYYTSSTTRRTGGDGLMVEESKEADTTTGRATHRISRGIRNKGHSFTRKLNPDGNVNTVQTLHNMNEDELAGFEESWKGSASKHLPRGWNQLNSINNGHSVVGTGLGTNGQASSGWALPSTESLRNQGRSE